jgi:hypothetical protein
MRRKWIPPKGTIYRPISVPPRSPRNPKPDEKPLKKRFAILGSVAKQEREHAQMVNASNIAVRHGSTIIK